jgi:hypothetical protein
MHQFIRSTRAVLLISALLGVAHASSAQVAKSFEIGLPFGPSGETSILAMQVGFRVASIRPAVPGVDFSIATMPVALASGLAVLSSDLDLTYPIPLGTGAILAPRVGASVLAAGLIGGQGGGSSFGGAAGYNVGFGFVGRTGETTAVRFDFTTRRFGGEVAVSSLTMGFVWTH